MAPAVVVADELAEIWGNAPCYVDARQLPHGAGASPLEDIAAEARARGLTVIPATRLDAPAAYHQAVANVVRTDGRGIGLLVDLQEMSTAHVWQPNGWPYRPADTDLVLDLAETVAMALAMSASVIHAFQTLHRAGQWRSVTIAGSSMPQNFAGFAAGLHTIDRAEMQLWQLAAQQLPYRIDFSDYATVPTVPAPQGIAWGFPINVKYTLDGQFLVCRGVPTTGYGGVDMDQQLIGHANSIVPYPNRHPLSTCWADGTINDIAAGIAGPGNLEHWVQIGVNRHIEITRALLP